MLPDATFPKPSCSMQKWWRRLWSLQRGCLEAEISILAPPWKKVIGYKISVLSLQNNSRKLRLPRRPPKKSVAYKMKIFRVFTIQVPWWMGTSDIIPFHWTILSNIQYFRYSRDHQKAQKRPLHEIREKGCARHPFVKRRSQPFFKLRVVW